MDIERIPDVIEPGRLYTAREARARLRIGVKTWKRMRTEGLSVVYYGGRHVFIFGSDIIRFFREWQEAARKAEDIVAMVQGTSALEGQAVSPVQRERMVQQTIRELMTTQNERQDLESNQVNES